MRPDVMILVFWMLSFKPAFSLYSFTFIKRIFSFSLLSAIRVVSSAYLRLLKFSWQSWFPLEIQELYRCLLCLLPWGLSNAWPLEAPVSSRPLLLKVRGEGEDRGWDGWMALPTQWTWVSVISRSWWWTGRLGVLQSMGLQRVGHDWATELTDWLTRSSSPGPEMACNNAADFPGLLHCCSWDESSPSALLFLILDSDEQWTAGDKHCLNCLGKIFLSFVSTYPC